jgi:hypothetical protein
MIKIVCTSCQKPLSLDETKLPMKEVAFPCPVCKNRLTVDRRNFEVTAPAPHAAPPAAPVENVAASDEGHDPHEDDDGFGSKAIIVGIDHPALRQAVKLVGFMPQFFAAPQQAREFFMQEFPQLVIIHPGQLTPPPLEAMQPIIALMPPDRRRSFFVLVAEGLRTLDGNAAFLYGVNLVLAMKDVPQFPQVYRDAHGYHERLYASVVAVTKAMNA